MQNFLATVPSAYRRFRVSENPRNQQPLAGFWPVLFDYRGKSALANVEASIGTTDGYKILASILTDAHIYHGVDSITFKKTAFIQTEEEEIYDVSDYRVPRSHCTINEGAKVRLDQPRFTVDETEHEVTVSLHEKYLELIQCLIPPTYSGNPEDSENTDMEVDKMDLEETDDFGLEVMFGSQEELEDEELVFSQEFSQVSLEDTSDITRSPAYKKVKLSTKTPDPEDKADLFAEHRNSCPFCGVYIGGKKGQLNRHILKSCPNNPEIDAIEAARRKKRADKETLVKVEPNLTIKSELTKKEDKKEASDYPVPSQWNGGDCGCRGTQHLPSCLRLCGGAAHMRLP